MIEAYYQKEERLWFLYCYEDFDLKSKVIIRTLINTAVRVSELVNMKVADIDFERGVVPVYMPKTRNWKEVPLYEPTIKAIKQMLEERTVESEYLLCVERRGDGRAKLGSKMSTGSVRRRLDRWAKRFNFRMNPHSFRHGIVTVWYKKLGLLAAAKLAGHIDLKYTAHYSHISGDEIREMGTKILPHEMWDAGSFVNSES